MHVFFSSGGKRKQNVSITHSVHQRNMAVMYLTKCAILTSGNVSPRISTTALTRVAKKPGLAFSFSVAYLTARRRMRRKTYLRKKEKKFQIK